MKAFAIGVIVCVLGTAGIADGQTTQRIRGDVAALHERILDVSTGVGGIVSVRLLDDLRVSAETAANAAAIVPGAYIATTATPQPDGTLSAVEVRIFPESMRGVGEGHRPLRNDPGSTMTNATVTGVTGTGRAASAGTMTNATVASVARDPVARVTLRYKDGAKTVVIGEGVPIVRVEPGDESLLVPGAHVVLTATKQADGTLAASRISVGRNGLVPPN